MNLKLISSCLLPVIGLSCAANKGKTGETGLGKPNVILIYLDDLGYGDLSCYGQKMFATPHIDQMAKEGVLFTQMYASSSVCAPSRASLMTGKHQGYASVRANRPDQLVGDDEFTIAKLFRDNGYATAAIGKWGLGHPPPPDDPQKKGFDYFYGFVNMYHAHNYYPEFLYENSQKISLNNKLAEVNGENPWADKPEGTGVSAIKNEYVHDLFDARALEFIGQNKNSPFFLYLPYTAPHSNTEGKAWSGDGMEVPDYYEFANKDWPEPEKGFAAMIRNIDNSVKMILDKLKEAGIEKNTLVLLTSDNGPHQSGGHLKGFFNSGGSLRGMKADLYEGGIRVPCIAWWPGIVPKGEICHEPLVQYDFLATFADLIGDKRPNETNGISFLPALKGEELPLRHDFLYWEFYTWSFARDGGLQAIRKGDWKAIRLNISAPQKEEIIELYNLKTDPGETTNLAPQHPDMVKEFLHLFDTHRTEFEIFPLFSKK